MKAVAIVGEGDAATLQMLDVPEPVPDEHQVLVRVRAAGLNRTDLRRTQQHFKQDAGPHIAGLELAGEVVACGGSVSELAVGDRVMAMTPGAYAEYALADARTALRIPEGVGWPAAAAIPAWYMTAHNALVTEARMARSRSVLVTAAASGVGITTISLARWYGASRIFGTSSSRAKAGRLAEIGLDDLIVPSEEGIGEAVQRLTEGRGVDIIIDMVGAGVLGELLEAAALGGTIVSVGRMGGFHDRIDLDKLALKRLKLVGVTFRTLDLAGKVAVRDAAIGDLAAPLAAGELTPPVDREFALEDALAAQEYMKQNKHFGKIVLIP